MFKCVCPYISYYIELRYDWHKYKTSLSQFFARSITQISFLAGRRIRIYTACTKYFLFYMKSLKHIITIQISRFYVEIVLFHLVPIRRTCMYYQYEDITKNELFMQCNVPLGKLL